MEFFLCDASTRRLQYDRLLREAAGYPTADRSRIAGELSAVYETIGDDHILSSYHEAVDSQPRLMSGALASYEDNAFGGITGDDDAQKEPEEASTGSSSISKYRVSSIKTMVRFQIIVAFGTGQPAP